VYWYAWKVSRGLGGEGSVRRGITAVQGWRDVVGLAVRRVWDVNGVGAVRYGDGVRLAGWRNAVAVRSWSKAMCAV
jgi:hypothetical protein